MGRANGWTARARLTWAAVVLAGVLVLLAALLPVAGGGPAAGPAPADWLVLAALAGAAVLLALRPVELGPDWKVSLANAPAFALALLFPPAWAAPAGAAAMAATQILARRPARVALFNVAQRTLAVAGAAATAAGVAGRAPGDAGRAGLAALAGAAVYFVINTGSVAAMAAARRGTGWPAAWRDLARTDGPAEAGLLAAGALLAVLLRAAPAAVVFVAPPVWLARRVLADAGRLRRVNARLEAALDDQRRFLADAAHELRTPVASLRAHVALLRQAVAAAPAGGSEPRGEDAAVTEMLAQMTQETARLSALLADLLTLARADEGAPATVAPVDLEELLVAVYREVQPLAGGVRLTLDVDAGAGAPVVRGDPERLRQMLLNLVTNALRFTPAGGRVTLSCRQGDGHAVLRVADSGAGIAAADLPHVFDRFYRADAARARDAAGAGSGAGGAGLGLSIARWAAETHGGTITATSAPGRGSVFTVRLPLGPSGGPPGRAPAPRPT